MAADERFLGHRDPVWRDRANAVVNAALDGRQGYFEQLPARQLTASTFELCCIPFFLYDIALGDVVRVSQVNGQHRLIELAVPAGRAVFRVWFGDSFHPREDIVRDVLALGALIEWSSPNMLAVDAGDAAMARQVGEFLDECERHGRAEFETGRSS